MIKRTFAHLPHICTYMMYNMYSHTHTQTHSWKLFESWNTQMKS